MPPVCQTTLLLLIGVTAAGAADGPPRIDLLSNAPNAPWHLQRFDSTVPATRFNVRMWDGVNAIETVADDSMALLVRPLARMLTATPVLCWRWRVDAPLKAADLATKAGDDFAARVYIAFRLQSDDLSRSTRTKLRIARVLYGNPVPDAAINYVWDNRYPIGTVRPNAYTDRTQMIVLRSGPVLAAGWTEERRDVLGDLESLFGTEDFVEAFVAIGTDTDNTHEQARAGFAELHLVARSAPCAFKAPAP